MTSRQIFRGLFIGTLFIIFTFFVICQLFWDRLPYTLCLASQILGLPALLTGNWRFLDGDARAPIEIFMRILVFCFLLLLINAPMFYYLKTNSKRWLTFYIIVIILMIILFIFAFWFLFNLWSF